jgi:hypothetical protein
MNFINENDQIRKSLTKIRSILTEAETINLNQDGAAPESGEETTKSGDEIRFDGINTVGFLNSQEGLSDEVKSALTTAVGEFIQASGLLLDTISISVEDSRIIMRSETIKNPGTDSIKAIVFDTDQDNAQIEVINGTIGLDTDLVNMIQTVARTFSDNQIGRSKLVSITQGGVQ